MCGAHIRIHAISFRHEHSRFHLYLHILNRRHPLMPYTVRPFSGYSLASVLALRKLESRAKPQPELERRHSNGYCVKAIAYCAIAYYSGTRHRSGIIRPKFHKLRMRACAVPTLSHASSPHSHPSPVQKGEGVGPHLSSSVIKVGVRLLGTGHSAMNAIIRRQE